ncbi:MAG: hypothetical protein VST68_06330 [Nitrospirota bacterium]|nr:hypothetical protein [Nitrospirota bacterium]
MVGILIRKISLWWRFKQLDRTFQPLIEKAIAFENREALLKLEEQYWYKTACLIEERRHVLRTQHGSPKPRKTSPSPAMNHHLN